MYNIVYFSSLELVITSCILLGGAGYGCREFYTQGGIFFTVCLEFGTFLFSPIIIIIVSTCSTSSIRFIFLIKLFLTNKNVYSGKYGVVQ